MTKTKEFKFRLSEKEYEEMRELAEQEGRTMSNLLRYLVAKEREEKRGNDGQESVGTRTSIG